MPYRGARSIAFLGNYLPRKCGIATFTTDTCNAVAKAIGDSSKVFAIAMTDTQEGYEYPDMVKFSIREQIVSDYEKAADYINSSKVGMLCVQHEYGIYGGRWGEYLLVLLRKVRVPIVTVKHTILQVPKDEIYTKVTEELIDRSDKIVVMADRAINMLVDNGVPRKKIELIRHGIPDFPFSGNEKYKESFDLGGKTVILTFGLLRESKGIEYMIEAMSKLVPKHPDLVFVVLGATHPGVIKKQGEKYRHKLMRLVEQYGLKKNVVFHDRFVELDELCEYINASDFYAVPYLIREQIVSGTMCYALGAGKVVVSTPSWCAEDILADGRGVIVPFANGDAFAEAIDELMKDKKAFNTIREKAYKFGRSTIWPNVAKQYLDLFEKLRLERGVIVSERRKDKTPILSVMEFPVPKLDHVLAMTDEFGILKNALNTIPRYEHGYSTDDNARAIVLASKFYRLTGNPKALLLLKKYLAYVFYAQREDGLFRGSFSVTKEHSEDPGIDICQGRALWGLGYSIGYGPKNYSKIAKASFDKALPHALKLGTKATAYAALGLYYYLSYFKEEKNATDILRQLADKLVSEYEKRAENGWVWFEDELSWASGVMPSALWAAHFILSEGKYKKTAIKATDFLIDKMMQDGKISTLKAKMRTLKSSSDLRNYTPKPVDALWMVEVLKFSYRMTKDEKYLRLMRKSFDWLLGYNDLEIALYDRLTGGCYDGMDSAEKNLNQGAESTISAALSLLSITEMAHQQSVS